MREREAQRLSLTVGDTNNPKCLGFHSVKPRKVRREPQPKGESSPLSGCGRSFVCGQEHRCAKEGFCMTEDAQSATGFGGQLGNVAFPEKIMANSETQKLE